MYDLTFGLGVAAMAILGIVALLIAMFGKKYIGSAKGVVMALAIGALLCSGVTYVSGIYSPAAPEEVVPSNTYAVTCAEAETEVSVNEASNLVTWKLDYNITSNALANSTGAITLNFTIALGSGLEVENIAASIGMVPEVDQSGSATDIEILDENTDGTSNADWVGGIKGASATYGSIHESMTMYFDPAAGTMYATVTLNAEATAFATHTAADEGTVWSMDITVAGNTYTVDIIAWNFGAAAGS